MERLNEARQNFRFDDAVPTHRAEPENRKQFRTRVFKSGNSLAVRIPAGTDLKAGMEMDLTVEDGVMLALKPIDAPKRKIDVSGFWGKAPGARLIPQGDFDERPTAIAARKAQESR